MNIQEGQTPSTGRKALNWMIDPTKPHRLKRAGIGAGVLGAYGLGKQNEKTAQHIEQLKNEKNKLQSQSKSETAYNPDKQVIMSKDAVKGSLATVAGLGLGAFALRKYLKEKQKKKQENEKPKHNM